MGDGNMGSAEDEAGVSPCAPIENLPPSAVAPPGAGPESVLPPARRAPTSLPGRVMGSWLSAGPLRTGEGGEAAGSVLEVRGGLQICAFESKGARILGPRSAAWSRAGQGGGVQGPAAAHGLPLRGRLLSGSQSSLPLWRSLNVEFK